MIFNQYYNGEFWARRLTEDGTFYGRIFDINDKKDIEELESYDWYPTEDNVRAGVGRIVIVDRDGKKYAYSEDMPRGVVEQTQQGVKKVLNQAKKMVTGDSGVDAPPEESELSEEDNESVAEEHSEEMADSPAPQSKKKRGRPRKSPVQKRKDKRAEKKVKRTDNQSAQPKVAKAEPVDDDDMEL